MEKRQGPEGVHVITDVTSTKRGKSKYRRVGYGVFDFASVALAAAGGHLDMDTFAEYLGAMRPGRRKKARKNWR